MFTHKWELFKSAEEKYTVTDMYTHVYAIWPSFPGHSDLHCTFSSQAKSEEQTTTT